MHAFDARDDAFGELLELPVGDASDQSQYTAIEAATDGPQKVVGAFAQAAFGRLADRFGIEIGL